MTDAIRFVASVARVKTMADGGYRLELDLPETALGAVTSLMEVKQAGALLEVAAVAVKQESNRIENAKIPTRSEWKP